MKAKQLALSVSHEGTPGPNRQPTAPSGRPNAPNPKVLGCDTPSSPSRKCWKSAAIAGFHFMLFTFSYFALRRTANNFVARFFCCYCYTLVVTGSYNLVMIN